MAKVKKGREKDFTKEGYPILRNGTVLTPELEERWNAEMDEGLDFSRARRVRVGRPPLDGERISQRVTIRLQPDLYEAALAKAAKEKRTVSNLAREALERYVNG